MDAVRGGCLLCLVRYTKYDVVCSLVVDQRRELGRSAAAAKVEEWQRGKMRGPHQRADREDRYDTGEERFRRGGILIGIGSTISRTSFLAFWVWLAGRGSGPHDWRAESAYAVSPHSLSRIHAIKYAVRGRGRRCRHWQSSSRWSLVLPAATEILQQSETRRLVWSMEDGVDLSLR